MLSVMINRSVNN